uniref:PHD-type domain-containing protein n=1 Tax=Nelumbo nucifera TaxID=4432 RepID=A0A822XKP2_NELNU|nr:TPA_asm: hypothetical protein HUJ06_019581 [Nelumbo nucifera]
MTRRKERAIKELYDVTEKIAQPEITPVLKGSCRIQGPVDEAEHDNQKNTGSFEAQKGFGRHYPSGEDRMRAGSGTCNVCATPCSSCMHFNQAASFMESRPEFSDETSRGKAVSRCSFNDGEVICPFKRSSRAYNDRQPTASETSNLLSTSSSHDSISGNADSKATLRTFDVSYASEDVDMLLKSSSGGTSGDDQPILKSQSIVDQTGITSSHSHFASDLGQRTLSNQDEEQKVLECHGDNISCVSRANDANVQLVNLNMDIDRKNVSCSSASFNSFPQEGIRKALNIENALSCVADLHCEIQDSENNTRRPNIVTMESVQKSLNFVASVVPTRKSDSLEMPSSKDVYPSRVSPKVQSPYSHSQSGNSVYHEADVKDLEENSSSHAQGEPSECSTEHVEASLTKSNSFLASVKIYPCLEGETNLDNSRDPSAETVKSSDQNQNVEKSCASREVPDMHEPALQSEPVDDSAGSDIVEDDVKVCDICGDAGREELLAFCSRCSDGAEHTYCMQVMLDKVPEGDWLCEECKIKEETENQKQDKVEIVLGSSKAPYLNEKTQNPGGIDTVSSKVSLKLDVKETDTEGNRITKVSSSSFGSVKRHSDNLEAASPAKRQMLETSVASPKTSSPDKKPVLLSRESSFKSLDKGKVKTPHQLGLPSSHSANSSHENVHSPTTGPSSSKNQSQLQSPRGNLLKSNSFNTLNSKPKVKLVQEDVSQKKKVARDTVINDAKKEGPVRMIGKSISFKTPSSGRFNVTESKVKMLSHNLSCVEELKGLKQAKEWGLIERKNSFKSDRPLISSPTAVSSVSTPKTDQKVTSRGETTSSLTSATNCRDMKSVQADGKLNTSAKPTSLANKGSENRNVLAGSSEVKRQSVVGTPSSNGRCSSTEQKPIQVSTQDGTTSSSWTADKSWSKHDAVPHDGLPQSPESLNQDAKARELFPTGRPKQGVSVGGQSIRCHKCKELGHTAQSCPVTKVSVFEASAEKSSKEVTGKSFKLKEAVKAIMLKPPGMSRKNRLPEWLDELSMSSADLSCEVSKDQLPTTSNCSRNLNSGEVTNDGQEIVRSSAADISKTAVKSVMLKPPGMSRKNRLSEQLDELSMSSADLSYEVSKDQLPTPSNCSRNLNSGEVTNDGQEIVRSSAADISKTAVKSVMLKPPGMSRKNRLSEQLDELSMSSADLSCEVSKDQLPTTLNCSRNLNSGEVTNDGQESVRSSAADISKTAVKSVMLKPPGMSRKNRLSEQLDELSMSSADLSCEVSKDQLPTTSNCSRNLNSGEVTNDGQEIVRSSAADISKTAVKAVTLKSPGMSRRNRLSEQLDELSMSSADLSCEVSKDQLPTTLNCSRNLNSGEVTNDDGQEIVRSSAADISKTTTVNNLKQDILKSTEATCSPRGASDVTISPISLDENKPSSSITDLPRVESSVAIPSRISAIPEHDYIWQGGFEVQRSGILADLCDGIQAYLSTCASPKIPEVVKKLPRKVLLEEVPRLSTWPRQFDENRATEDNVALYFFAKDLESYERYYKGLLDKMIKNDLALKGNFNGIELLIFPSNQLPEKSQRWNMLFFLWGVFRGRRSNCSEQILGAQKKVSRSNPDVTIAYQGFAAGVTSVSQKVYLPGHKEDPNPLPSVMPAFTGSSSGMEVSKSMASMELPFISSSGKLNGNGNCDSNMSSIDYKNLSSQTNFNQHGNGLDSDPLSRLPIINVQLSTEKKVNSNTLKEQTDLEGGQEVKVQSCLPATRQNGNLYKGKMVPMHLDNSLDRENSSSCSCKTPPFATSAQGLGGLRVKDEEKIQDKMQDGIKDEVRVQKKMKSEECFMDIKTTLKSEIQSDQKDKEHGGWEFNSKKQLHMNSALMIPQVPGETLSSRSQETTWMEKECMITNGESELKKTKRCSSVVYDCNSSSDQSSFSEKFLPQVCDMGTGFSITEQQQQQQQQFNGSYEAVENLRATERHFFPIDLGPAKDCKSRGTLEPLQVLSSTNEDIMGSEVPNLELALGAEKRPRKQAIFPWLVGIADKRNNRDKFPDPVTNNNDDDVSASLSLSLAFPFSNKEQTVKPVSKTEQLLPDARHVNTSLFLFGGFSDA